MENTSKQRRVLVVDDNRDAADSLAMLLTRHDQDVRKAYDGPSALQAAQEFQPEIVFLDLVMPGMDGFDVALKLREQEQLHTRRMIIVALTGHGDPAYREASDEIGFDTYLTKPASPADLLGILTLS